jgi:hypothetical protein
MEADMKRMIVATLLAASALASGAPTAVEMKLDVVAGDSFHKTVVLDQDQKTEGGQLLKRGTYDVLISSLGGEKTRATFFQGGVRKGEANGIIIVGGSPAHSKVQKRRSFGDLGLQSSSPHALRMQGGKHNIVIGQDGSSQILIGLLQPGAKQGVLAPPQRR